MFGASGSGRSTLLDILGGRDRATSGSATGSHPGRMHQRIRVDDLKGAFPQSAPMAGVVDSKSATLPAPPASR
jgi:hypothetical protein